MGGVIDPPEWITKKCRDWDMQGLGSGGIRTNTAKGFCSEWCLPSQFEEVLNE